MAKFSPTDSVFAGFRFAKERPATLLIWSAYLLLVMAVAVLALFDLGGDQMTALVTASSSGAFDPALISKISEDILPASSFCMLLMVVFGSVLVTAILRLHLEPGPQPWGGLKFGGDELRVLGANALVILMVFCCETLLGLVADLGGRVGIPGPAVLFAGLLLILALHVRLSLTSVVAMAEKRISLRRSWLLTAQGFWPLLGAYVLLYAIGLVILLLVIVVFTALTAAIVMAGGGGNPVAMLMSQDFGGLNPVMIGAYMLMNLAQVWVILLVLTVSIAVDVAAYRAFKAP
jgi:hypothetical protein